MGTKTFYSVKWFVRKETTLTETVPVTDERHPEHAHVMQRIEDASRKHSAVNLPLYDIRATQVKVPNGESKLFGTYQSQFSDYPEPQVRTRDPKCVKGKDPAICSIGWHVPYLTHLEQFMPQVNARYNGGEAELWLVKVGGRHTPTVGRGGGDQHKAAFEYLELRKKLDLGDSLKLMKLVANAKAAREKGAVYDGRLRSAPYDYSLSYEERIAKNERESVNRPLRSLVDALRNMDRAASSNGWSMGRIGSAKFALLDPQSIDEAEAIVTKRKAPATV